MLGDLFDTEEEILTGQKEGALLSSYNRLPRDCAHELPLPEIARKTGYPVGLKNQGATCYLNGLFQVLFHSPQFRSMVLSLPLCEESDATKSSGYLDSEKKFNFVMAFQRLFGQMQILDAKSISTEHLSKAFGWENAQQRDQHDMHEAMRVILDTLERALVGTPVQKQVKSHFRGQSKNYITCLKCGNSRETPNLLFDLLVQTKHMANLDESLNALITPEEMSGSNGIHCELCAQKTDSLLGLRLVTLPNILIVTLSRFEFDYDKMDRAKITTPLKFGLELDMTKYGVTDLPQYELYGVVIHRGSAHGGHYFAYVRDVLQESSWRSNLEKKETEDNKEEKKEAPKEPAEKLSEVSNKSLLQNWYEINDQKVIPIEASKIATQFGGTECAYILFYRRKGLVAEVPKVPEYISQPIIKSNEELNKVREHYENERQHILLKIDGNEVRIKKSTKVSDLLKQHCAADNVLLNVQSYNELPYYPKLLTNSQKTLEEEDIVHLSNWESRPADINLSTLAVGKDCIPITINIMYESKLSTVKTYQNVMFLHLRNQIEDCYKLPYELQIITLDGTYKDQKKNLAEDMSNDELTLLQLKIIHQSQLFVDRRSGTTQQQQKHQEDLVTVIIERDDEQGIKRIYVERTILLNDLLTRIKTGSSDQKRRLRWLNGNRLFFAEQYTKTLKQLNIQDSMLRLRLERGEIPIKGEACVKVKLQSKLIKEFPEQIELIVDPSQSVSELKILICSKFNADPAQHKIYRTDWQGNPTRPVTRQNLTLFQSNFSAQQTICLRDVNSPTNQQLIHFNISLTKTGFPDDREKFIDVKCEETRTLRGFKEMILEMPQVKTIADGKNYKHLRLRELKRDYMFGTILKGHDRTLKAININELKLVMQILDFEQDLTDDDIVLVLKNRISEERLYGPSEEFVFHCPRVPKIVDLKKAILEFKKLEVPLEELRIIKYYIQDFQWIEYSQANFTKWVESIIKRKEEAAKNKQKHKQEAKNKGKKKDDKKEEDKKEDTKGETNKEPAKQEATEKVEDSKPKKEEKQQKPKQPKQPKEENATQQKEQKSKKQPQQQAAKKDVTEEQNLRRAPFLLRDGDMIGYGFACEMLVNDDLQTQDDQNLKAIKENELGKMKGGKKRAKQNPFELYVDF